MSGSEWRDFFDGHAPRYDENIFTRNTVAEVDFAIETLRLRPGAAILDVGCGTGRHAIELARRGFAVTGIDLSSGMLERARAKAGEAGVQVAWHQADATEFCLDTTFDAVICLCEGAFGLLGSTDDAIGQPLAIVENIASAMKPGARCLLTVLNGYRLARRHTDEGVARGDFDPLTLTERSECSPYPDATAIPLRERGFVPTELTLLFGQGGLEVSAMWGGTAGNWGKRAIDLDEIEIMVLARRPWRRRRVDDAG